MSVARKKSPYDRRIRELQREAELLQRNIRSTAKTLAKSGVDLDSLAARPLRPAPPAAEFQKTAEPLVARTNAPPATVESDAMPAPSNRYATPPEKKVLVKDERFASYLASGSFGRKGPLSGERKLQRNRAIFMVIVVGLAVFLLYRFIF